MQSTFLRPLEATALVAFFVSASSLQGAAFSGTAYDGFDYAGGNIPQPGAVAPFSAGLAGGTGWNATGTATTWGVTLGSDNATYVNNGRYALNSNNSAAASANQLIVGGLSYSGLATSGGAAQITGAGSVGRNFGQNIDSGTFYFSYLTQKTVDTVRTTNVAFHSAAATAGATPVERLSIGQIANNTTYLGSTGTVIADSSAIANKGDFQVLLTSSGAAFPGSTYNANGIIERNSSTTVNSVVAEPMTLNATYLVVGKIEFNVGANSTDDRLTLYLNPTNLAVENTANAYFSVTGVDFGTLTGFRMFSGAAASPLAASSAVYDEFRFGTSFSDVVVAVPEPTTAALGGLGVLGLFLRRRRA